MTRLGKPRSFGRQTPGHQHRRSSGKSRYLPRGRSDKIPPPSRLRRRRTLSRKSGVEQTNKQSDGRCFLLELQTTAWKAEREGERQTSEDKRRWCHELRVGGGGRDGGIAENMSGTCGMTTREADGQLGRRGRVRVQESGKKQPKSVPRNVEPRS